MTLVKAMLLNEFLKEHQKVQKLEWTVAKQESDFKASPAARASNDCDQC